ncbi:MAG: homoserine kinase [Deltaproteobacteria bacterium]|nr:homoserine kinase [Deltaproteobacteria bacterium]
MGVYTSLDAAEVTAFLAGYGLGRVSALEPIREGIENTNYRVTAGTPERRYVLTVFERDAPEVVAETLRLTAELSARGVPCPGPLAARGTGALLSTLRGKPASLVPFVDGEAVMAPGNEHLEALGRALAELHLAGADLPFDRGGAHRADTLCPLAERLAERVRSAEPALAELMAAEAAVQAEVPETGLPGGVIHADLFLDNVLFDGGSPPRVKALLDFHLAGRGPWLFDLAVVLDDAGWGGGGVRGERARAFLGSYRAVRPLEPAEFSLLPAYLRRVALRFLCLRVERFLLGGPQLVAGHGKDPREYARRLEILRAGPAGGA